MSLNDKLSVILEEPDHSALLASCVDLCDEIDSLKERINIVKQRLKSMKVRLCAELALLIRKKYPSLNIAVDKKGTKVGYKSKIIYISPDIEGRIWSFKTSDPSITKAFNNKYKKYLIINGDLSGLADALGACFAFKYKSLKESHQTKASLLIEGRKSQLTDLVDWANKNG